jgi:predicted membrane protein
MNNQKTIGMPDENGWKKMQEKQSRGKIVGGLLFVAIGSLFLARELGSEIPNWVFSWKMLLIGLGIVSAIKHRFMEPSWIILIGIGGAFLLNDLFPDLHIRPFLWPVLFILIGLFMIFKPRRKNYEQMRRWRSRHHNFQEVTENTSSASGMQGGDQDFIEITSIFSGSKKNVLSKNFKGGEIVNIFGGSYLNLSQADLAGDVSLQITQVFGGTKLIVPADWEIRSQASVMVAGGIEDKRQTAPNNSGEKTKILTISGTTVFGGIEIKSFN